MEHNPSDTVPQDSSLCLGTLPNGLTYYVKSNLKPANTVELRLLVKVGSLVEEEHERGLAHFVEHMAFKGTASYGTGELIRIMESIGIQYGQCLNASTGQDKTIYKLTVPLGGKMSEGDEESGPRARLELAMGVLAEFASSIRISDQDVETERGVIEEERRNKAGPAKRLVEAYWQAVFGGEARYGTRFPIGLSEVVQGAPPADVREFYRKWYHPTLMAVVVVGDFSCLGEDNMYVVDSVVRMFSTTGLVPKSDTFPLLKEAKVPVLPTFPLPSHQQGAPVCCYYADPGLTSTQVSLEFFESFDTTATFSHVRADVTKRLLTSLVDHRLSQIARGSMDDGARPFLWAGISMRPIVKDLLCTGLSASVVESTSPDIVRSSLERGIQSLLAFSKRVTVHGFHVSELNFAKHKWRTAFKAQLEDAENRASGTFVEDYMEHFMRNGKVPLGANEHEIDTCLSFVDDVSLDEINAMASYVFNIDNTSLGNKSSAKETSSRFQVICVQRSAVDDRQDETYAVLNTMIERAIASAKDIATQPWPVVKSTLGFTQKGKKSVQPKSSLSSAPLPVTGATEFRLANGLIVCVKRTPELRRGQFSFQAFALGGSSNLTEPEDHAFAVVDDVAELSGLADLDPESFLQLRSTLGCRVNMQRHMYHRGLGGSAPSDRIPELLEMLAVKLTPGEQSFQPEALLKCIEVQLEGMRARDHQPEFTLMERARILANGDVALLRPTNPELLAAVKVNELERLWESAFTRNPSEFTFVFIGDIPLDNKALFSLLDTHLGHLGVVEIEASRASHNPGAWASAACHCRACDSVEKNEGTESPWKACQLPTVLPTVFTPGRFVVRKGANLDGRMRATTLVVYQIAMPQDVKEGEHLRHWLRASCSWLEVKLLAVLRTEKSLVYNVSVSTNWRSLGETATVNISWTCDPSVADESLAAVLLTIREASPLDVEVEAIKAMAEEKHALALTNNSYWMFWLLDAYKAWAVSQARKQESKYSTTVADRAAWVDSAAAINSVNFSKILTTLTSEGIRNVITSSMPESGCLAITLLPEDDVLNESSGGVGVAPPGDGAALVKSSVI